MFVFVVIAIAGTSEFKVSYIEIFLTSGGASRLVKV